MRASKALLMRRASESLRSLEGSERTSDDEDDESTNENSVFPATPVQSTLGGDVGDGIERLVPGHLVDLGGRRGCTAVGVCGEREWILRASHQRVHLDVVDETTKSFECYQWFAGQHESDIPLCCTFCPPLIPLQPPSSLHECRSLQSNGTFAIAWLKSSSASMECYVRVYDPVETSVSLLCHDWKWTYEDEFHCKVGQVNSIAFSPGGAHVLVGGCNGLQLWNLSLKEEIWSMIGSESCPRGVNQVQFSPEGRLFASVAPRSKMVRLWWRSESAGGFAYLLLPHGDPVRNIAWRPRSSSSTYGTAQTLLTQSESGHIRVWQESDPLEDFDFYVVCEITTCSPNAHVSWIHYYADYNGLMWPPPSSFRKRKTAASGPAEEEPKKLRNYSSRRVWGAMERGHGHAWFGEAAYDNVESRLGGFSPQSNTRDWIVSHDAHKLSIWAVEGLGEHARSAIRCQIWAEEEVSMPDYIESGLAYCRFLIPAFYEGKTMPRCDELFADNPPVNLRICGQASCGSSCALGVFRLGNGGEQPTTTQVSFDYDFVFTEAHQANHIRFLGANSLTKELLTVDHEHRMILWDTNLTSRRAFDLNCRVRLGCFCPNTSSRALLTVDDITDRIVAHSLSESVEISSPVDVNGDERSLYGEIVGVCELKGRVFIVRESGVFRLDTKEERFLVMKLKVRATAVSYAADMQSAWIGSADGSLSLLKGTEEMVGDSTVPDVPVATLSRASTASSITHSKKNTNGWSVQKISCAGMWVARLLEGYTSNSKPVVFIASLASNLMDDLEEENSHYRVVGLNEDSREVSWSVVDIALCDLGGSICALAVLLSDGTVCVATRKSFQWHIVASSSPLPTVRGPIALGWLSKGRIAVFNRLGAVTVLTGWTASVPLSWNFACGLTSGWSVDDCVISKRAQLIKRQSLKKALSDQLASDESATFADSTGHLTHLCASTQIPLPNHHPSNLLENFRQGRMDRVESILKHVFKCISDHLLRDRPVQISPCPETSSTPGGSEPSVPPPPPPVKSAASLLFATPSSSSLMTNAMTATETAMGGGGGDKSNSIPSDWLNQLELRLPLTKIAGVSPSDHLTLLSCVNLFRRLSDEKISGLDSAGSRFAVAVETIQVQNRGSSQQQQQQQMTTNATSDISSSLRTCEVIWALHSDAQNVLIKNFLERPNTVWGDCRNLGAGFWVQNPQDCKSLMERLAKTHFLKYDKDPFRSLLFYSALGKIRVVSALFKTSKNEKVAILLAQDFTQERWKLAAVKNAYALVEKRRYEEAAGFFLLGNKINEALRVLSRNLEDYQLALFVGKVVMAMGVPEAAECYQQFLKESYLEVAMAAKDPWLCSMIFTLLGDAQNSVRCFAPDYFTQAEAQKDKEDPTGRNKRMERYVWLRKVASRDRPRCGGFDPVVQQFLRYVLGRAPFYFNVSLAGKDQEQHKEFTNLMSKNRRRAALFYLSQGMPKFALDFIIEEEQSLVEEDEELKELNTQAQTSSALPMMLISSCTVGIATECRERVISCFREMSFVRSYLDGIEGDDAERLQLFVEETIAPAFRSLAYGGCSIGGNLSARRLACYSLVLNENIDRFVMEPEKQMASVAAYAGVVLSALMLKQYNLLDAFFSAGPFEIGKPLRFAVVSGAARLTREYLDYEETVSLASPLNKRGTADNNTDWAQSFARGVLKLLIFERLVESIVERSSRATPEVKQSPLVQSVCALITRLKSDLHVGAAAPENPTFAVLVDPLRPFMATSRSFEDFNEQALWTRFGGPERILKLVGEIAHSARFRNRRPFLPTYTAPSSSSAANASLSSTQLLEAGQIRKGPLTSIMLYQNHGENLSGVVITDAFGDHMVVASLDRGVREVNIKSSLKFRNRTPDGRSLTDAEKSTWAEVYSRFAEEEKADSDEGWELFLSASATGMRHRHVSNPNNNPPLKAGSPSTPLAPSISSLSGGAPLLFGSRSERAKRAGSFLSYGGHRLGLTLKNHTLASKKMMTPQQSNSAMPSRDDPVTRIAAHPFLPCVASGYVDGSATLWSLGEARGLCKFQRPNGFSGRSPITRLRMSPDGFKVLGGDASGRCSLWQIELGDSQPFTTLTCAANNRQIMDCAFLNLSSVFATCSLEGVVSLWDTLLPPRSSCVASWYNPTPPSSGIGAVGPVPNGLCSLAFSPQTRKLFTGTERGSIYSIDVRQSRTVVEAKHVHQKPIMSLAISQDGYVLGSGSADGSIKLWSLDDLSLLTTVPNAHPISSSATTVYHQAVSEIVFAPNGSLFSCGADGTVKISYSSEAVI